MYIFFSGTIFSSSTADDLFPDNENDKVHSAVGGQKSPKSRKVNRDTTSNIITSLVSTLNRTKITYRAAMYVLKESTDSLLHDVNEVNINRISICYQQMVHRQNLVSHLKISHK